jgi:hypothetical protein
MIRINKCGNDYFLKLMFPLNPKKIKKNKIMKYKSTLLGIIFVFLLFGKVSIYSQSFPLQLTNFVKPPYPTKFEDWEELTEKIILNITNTTTNEYEVNLNLDINGPKGFNVQKKSLLNYEIELGSYKTVSLKGNAWDTYDMDLEIGDINPESERNFVVKNRAFREGNYTICWQATDKTGTIILSDKNQGCFNFDVVYGEPPAIINPLTNSIIQAQNPSLVTINWVHQLTGAPFEYKVKLIELTPSVPSDINQAMNNPGIPAFFENEGVKGFSCILRNEDFKAGSKYAIRVTADDPNENVYFKNAGHSDIIVFTYGKSGPIACDNLNNFKITPHFPIDGDTLPFTSLVLEGRFEPECENFSQIKHTLTFNKTKENETTVNWPNGALKFLQDGLNDTKINWQMASVIPFATKTLNRGQKYTWSVSSVAQDKTGKSYTSTLQESSIVVGMHIPKLSSPYKNEKVGKGIVTFSWEIPQRQKKLIPDFKPVSITTKDKKSTVSYFDIKKIEERWVLQVFSSDTPVNSKLVDSKTDKIVIDPQDHYNSAAHTYNASSLLLALSKKLTVDIDIKKEGDYWWRVVWLKDPNGSTSSLSESSIYHASSLNKFQVGAADSKDTGDSGDCIASCDAPAITDKTPIGDLKQNQVLKIGLFDLKVTKINSSKNNTFTGEGEIEITFLNKMRINVAFNDIQKNKSNQIISGSVKAVKDVSYFQQFFDKYETYAKYARMGAQKGFEALDKKKLAEELENLAKKGERMVSSFTGLRATGLPIGLDKEIEGNKFIIAIAEMEFTPQKAIMQSIIDIKIPALKINTDSSNILIFGTRDICFSPTAIGAVGTAFLLDNATFGPDKDGNEFVIVGGKKINNSSFLKWNCKGFKEISLTLEYKFSRNIIIPDDLKNNNRVIAQGTFVGTKGLNLLGEISIGDFTLPFEQMQSYGFKVNKAFIDLSNVSNPDGLNANLPKGYVSSSLNDIDPRKSNMWRGFWLKNVSLKIPKYIGNVGNDKSTSVSVNNLIIDESGFTANFLIENLVNWKEKKTVDGCAFSLDSLWVNVLQNNFHNAGLSGKIGIPFADSTSFFNYRGLFDNKKTSGSAVASLLITVNPKDKTPIKIPWLWAELSVEKSSYIKIALSEKESFVNFNINAKANISSEKFTKKDSKDYALKMPGIDIKNFGYDSKNGFKDIDISFASDQKWLAGFPLNLTNFKLTSDNKNPKVSFTITLSLMDKSSGNNKNSLSANTSLSIHTKFDASKPFENIGIDKVNLDSLSIDASFSQIRLLGKVGFYDNYTTLGGTKVKKNGFTGKISLTLPANFSASLEAEFGTIKKDNATVENTKDWYSYWRVYGEATIGSGIPVFSGVSLYGMGGGVYHHMQSKLSSSGVYSYEPDFNIALGLQFGVTIGSNDGGKAYNCKAKLGAEFQNNGGLEKLTIDGKLQIMNKDLNDKNSKIIGNLMLIYDAKGNCNPIQKRTSADSSFIYGKLEVYVDLGIVKGGMDSQNKMVQAIFYSSLGKKANSMADKEPYWFFNMGTPSERGKLIVDLSGKKDEDKKDSKGLLNIEFTSYLMIGHDIPTDIPSPSQSFLNIYKKAGGTTDFSGGKVESLLKDKKNVLPPGEGFAFGAAFSASIKADLVPFHFKASAALGFDINMTHNQARMCLETNQAPGTNGWYSTGQLYAGLELEVGIKVDLLFIKGDFNLFDAAAAMILQGGFPNPNWASGEGHLNYKILNGLFKGHYFFVFELGQKCTPSVASAEYLTQLKFIQDLKPSDNDKDVGVFTSCTATFALPIDNILEVPVNAKNIKKFRPEIHKWTLKDNKTGKLVPCDLIELNKEKLVATLSPKVILSGKNIYQQELQVGVKEYLNGYWTPVLDKKADFWSEKKNSSFTTGIAPEVIVEENVVLTYPIKNQRNFFKNETKNFEGYMVLKKGISNLFKQDRNYIVRFTKLDGSDMLSETNLIRTDDDRTLSFDVSSLQNNQYYCLQIVGKPKTSISNLVIIGGPIEPSFKLADDDNLLVGGRNVLTSDIIKKRSLPGNQLRNDKECLLYYYYFKTSKYNSFADKFNSVNWSSQLKSLLGIERFKAQTMIEESLEQYDKSGFKSNNVQIPALVSLTINDGWESGLSMDNNYAEYPLNLYIDDKVNPIIRIPVKKTNKVLTKSYINEQVEYMIASFSTAIEWGNKTSFNSPITNDEMNTALNQDTSSLRNSGYGVINGGGVISGGTNFGNLGNSGIYFSGLGSLETSSEVEIFDNMPIYGHLNFHRAKNDMVRVLSVELPLFDKNNLPKTYNLYSDPDYWVHKYLEYPSINGSKWTYYANKYKDGQPTIKDFLFIFYPQEGFMAYMLSILSSSYMNPPNENSFIMQYKYPAPYYDNNEAYMNKGTSFRVNYKK